MEKQFSAACERNSAPILEVLRGALENCVSLLEIGSGTGQHAVFFGAHLPHLVWQTSDLQGNHASILAWQESARLPNVRAPLILDTDGDWPDQQFDAVFSANTCHIMAWGEVVAMFSGIAQILKVGGTLCIYGPFNYNGKFTSGSNEQFDASLRAQYPHMGIRDFEAINALAIAQHLELKADHQMPANNRLLVWRQK